MDNEIWKDIPWYDWKYQVSSLWRVKNRLRIWKWSIQSKWYMVYWLNNESFLVHRIVGTIFLNPIEWKQEINHKNWDKTDNRVENLEWCTHKDNCKHAWNSWLCDDHILKKLGNWHPCTKIIIQMTKDGNFIKEWNWSREIQRETWFLFWSITWVCRWERKSAYWYIWKYK